MTALASMSAGWPVSKLLCGFAARPVTVDTHVSRLSLDSRDSGPGTLFLARRGRDGRAHGLEQAADAAARGCAVIAAEPHGRWQGANIDRLGDELGLPVVAVPGLARRAAAIAARFFGEPAARLALFAVAGGRARTDVCHGLARALSEELPCGIMAGHRAGIPGELDLLGSGPADGVALHATLAALAARGAGAVAIELPAAGRDGEALAFGHVIVLDGAGLEAVGAERLRQAQRGWAVLNHDDPACRGAARALGGRRRGIRLAAFSLDPGAEPDCVDVWVRAEGIEPLPRGVRIRVVTSAGRAEIDTRLLGRDSAAAMLAVLAVLLSRGATLDRARAALAAVPGMPGRMEAFGAGDAPLVVVDKADTPDALERALGQLRDHCRGRIITVFGSPCGREAHQRRRMGAVAERLSDSVIVTDDNPGGEDGDAICAAIVGGMRWPARSRIVRQRGLAIRRAIAVAGRGDAVLVAGKGRDNVQDMGELKVHFSDRAQVVQALGEWQGFGA